MKFFREALQSMKTTGAFAPSSYFLARKLIKPIDFEKSKVIIEFGAGTGAITKQILRRMPKYATLIAFEINEKYYKELAKIQDPRLKLQNNHVDSLSELLEDYNLTHVDYIVSGLPLAIFDNEAVSRILNIGYQALKSNGKYIQFHYTPKSINTLKAHFNKVEFDFTPINLPPALITICSKN